LTLRWSRNIISKIKLILASYPSDSSNVSFGGVRDVLKGIGLAAIVLIVVTCVNMVSDGGWLHYGLVIAFAVSAAILAGLRLARGSLAAAECEFQPSIEPGWVPTNRLQEQLLSDEKVILRLRTSPLSMLQRDFAWELTKAVAGKFGGVFDLLLKGLAVAIAGTPWFLVPVVAAVYVIIVGYIAKAIASHFIHLIGGIGHLIMAITFLLLVSVVYRIVRWRREVIVFTDRRLIIMRGVIAQDVESVRLESITKVDASRPAISVVAGYLRITKFVYGRLIIISDGRRKPIRIGPVAASLLRESIRDIL
jgi:hypothetical protein